MFWIALFIIINRLWNKFGGKVKVKIMSNENEVFRKIKEISTRTLQPRPLVNTYDLANELNMSREQLMNCLSQLKQTRLVSFNDTQFTGVRLTLLGSVVKRDK